jgi:hypothetical protein
MNDLTTYPVSETEIAEAINVALRGDYLDVARLITALENIQLGDGGLPAAATAAAGVALNLNSQIDMLRQAEERIAGRRVALEGISEAAKEWALRRMQEADMKAVHQTGQPSVTRHKNPPKVEVINEDDIPQQYRKMELVENIDKKGISTALKEGVNVPGARLTQTERLEIR